MGQVFELPQQRDLGAEQYFSAFTGTEIDNRLTWVAEHQVSITLLTNDLNEVKASIQELETPKAEDVVIEGIDNISTVQELADAYATSQNIVRI